MFAWKLILALALSQSSIDYQVAPIQYFPEGSPAISINAVEGDPKGDFAQAGRVLGARYEDTLGCQITLNLNSNAFRKGHDSGRGARGLSLVRHIQDGTLHNEAQKMFFIVHEVAHCFDNVAMLTNTDDLDGYRAWKEGYADAFAILVLKQQGIPEAQLATLATFREERLSGEFGKKWGAMLRDAVATDVRDKSDKNLLAIAQEIRRNVWKSS